MNDLDLFSDPYGRDGQPVDGPPGRRGQRTARKKQRKRKRKNSAVVFFSLAILVAVLGTGGVLGYAFLDNRMNPPDYEGQGAGHVTVQVKEGDLGGTIAATLQKHDVIKSVRAFMKVYANEPDASKIQPGYYQMRLRMSSKAAMAHLLDSKSRSGNQIIISEGLRATEVFARLSQKTGIPAKDFVAASRNPRALGLPSWAKAPAGALNQVEGYLFPGRYDLNPNATAAQILKQMVARFNQEAERLDLVNASREVDMRPEQVITMASLIQAEGGKPQDLPKIARVVLNRFKIGWPLAFDTSVLYFLNKRTLDVRFKETETEHPYNTYRHKGLTPGPISNPGEAAIKAVLKPASGGWMYFVATDPHRKITKFAETKAEFDQLVAEFRQWQRKNPGN
ncbi:endolytic transglycosylase MltG [Actinomadura hibisca]|uniref:endolytic transglycosylase MltG n=1 Tax=Actinomadura hibisca TaxID=68565 RepID=UPI00082E86F2|nr:endolytic transglycosylase MltG [Actinomadura hibisca]